MADTTSNIIKITGILNKYAWQNHKLLPEEIFQLLADRKAVYDENRDYINKVKKEYTGKDTTPKYNEYLDNFKFNKFTVAWHFPMTAGDISKIIRQELKDSITDETINNTLRKVMFSNALKTQEYRIQAVNAGVLKNWAEAEQRVAGGIATGWASIIEDCLCSVKAYVDKETYANLKSIMSSGERKEAESVVKLNNLLQYIADNEIQRNILKLDIKKLRRNGKISETADKVFKGLLSDTFSYVEILREEHLQERRLAFKDQNRIVHEEFLDTWFLRNKNIYRKYDTIDKSLRAGFAGEEVMEKSDLDKLYTPEFIRRLLQVARDNDIDLTESYLPKFTPDNEDFAKILKNGVEPDKDYITECGERNLDVFMRHLNEIAPEIKDAAEVFAKEKSMAFLFLLFRKLKTLRLQCKYRADYYRFYQSKLGVNSEEQYFYYLVRGSELPDKDRILLLNTLETGIPDQKVRRRIQAFIGKDLSLPRKNKELNYGEQIILELKEETENDLSNLLDQVNLAIRRKDKLKFEYGYIDLDGNKVTKQYMNQHGELKNKVYSVFPFGTVYQSGYFYMLAFFENDDPDIQFMPYTFRVDLMENVQIKDSHGTSWEDIKQIKSFENWERFDPVRYAKKHPHMYGEEKKENAEGNEKDSAKIRFRVKEKYVRYFQSAFGEDNCIVISATEKEMTVQTNVVIELNTSLGEAKIFALQYAPYCKVLSPGDLVREVKESFRKVAKMYGLDREELLINRNMVASANNLVEGNK